MGKKRTNNYEDITKYGTSGLGGVRANSTGDSEIDPVVKSLNEEAARSYHNRGYVNKVSDEGPIKYIGLELEQSGYGKSSYDKGIPYSQLSNIEDWRGQEQPWYAQLGAGIIKGVGLAGTTFLDGTVGFLYGIGQAIAKGDASMLFNNDFSVALRQFNQMMEEELPNYRTKDEIENPWALRNIFSMNTFADDFLKNLGFTVGAFYSGNAYLGALKGIGLAGRMSTSAAKLIGSTLSGFSEARIEAGNLYDEQIKAEQPNIDAAKERIKAEVLSAPEYTQAFDNLKQEYEAKLAQINAQPDNMVTGPDGRLTNPKTALQNQLFNEYQSKIKALENSAMSEINTRVQRLEQDVHERAKNAAIADMVLNAVYLPFTDAYAYGKLYGRKFNFKAELADKVDDAAKVGRKQATKAIDKAAEAEAIEETLGKRVVRQGKEYVANPVKAKQAAAKGLKIGLSEGSEEMNQAFFSSFSSNLYQPDSPDAYYNALKNDDYDIQTKDAMTALTEGFMDSWGNAQTYKEGLVGFLTGMIGMPTFGRVNNSDSNTYLGKGKTIGLSGGIFGEIQNANRLNREAAEAVQVMNKIQDRVDDAKSFFIRAKSFRDATDGYSKESNKFEFNSAADNELFHAIDAFARTGRLQDLKDIISEDIDNASQKQLEDIARNFSSDENQYKEVDGSDMASTEDGQKEMKDIINQRKKEIFDGIDSYQKALEKARRIGNNSLTSDQVAELAWLQWKVDKFSDRFNSIKDKDMNKLTELQNAIHAFKNGRGRGMIDEESEEGKNILQAIDTVDLFIDLLRTSKNPIQFGTLVKNSGNTRDWLRFFGYPIFEGMVGYNAEEFDDLINDLDDTVKIAEASESFNKRYKEFKADPTKLIKNREKIDKKKQSEKDVKDNADLKTSLDNMSVSEIAEKLRNKEISDDQIASIEDKERKAPIEPDIDLTAAQKLEQAMQINDAAERAIDALQQQMEQAEGGIEAFEDAVKQIEENMSKAESLDDFFDLSSAAFVDSQILAPEEPADLTPEQKEALDNELDDRRDAATAINKGILEKVKKDKETADNLPKPPTPGTEPEETSTGHDGTTQAKTVAETNKAKKETEKKEAEQPKIDYAAEAVELLRQFGIVAPDRSHQVNPLATLLDSFDKFTALDNNVLACIERCRNIAAYGVLARSIDPRYEKGNILPLIDNMLLTYAGKPKAVTKPTEEKTADEEDVVTPTISRTQIEGQERQESKRSYDSSPKTGPLNYWKPATTEYPIHDDNRENITYAQRLLNIATDEVIKLLPQVKSSDKSQLRNAIEDLVRSLLTEPLSQVQNSEAYKIAELLVGSEKLDKVLQMFTDGKIAKVDLQRTRRTVAVTDYLQDCKAYEKIDNGQVTKGTKVHFKVDKKLNEKAGETVILITDTEGNPLGDIMSKDEQIASRQVGLLPFIEKCEKYLEDHKDEEVVELPYESTISQLMVGRAPYVNEANRPTLNTVFEGQPFKIGVAMTAGANATIKMTSSPKSEKLTDEEASIWEPLSAIKGQPYLLLPTGNAKKKYICVPFLMPVYNSGVADTALGRAIRDVLSQIMDAETKENAVKVKAKLLELLSLKDIWINYDNGNVHFTVTRHGENSQRTLYKGPLNNNAIDAILNKLQGTSFRVNRKYINGDYEGQDYNSMIGELATCNIKKGTTHTINNWFTINPIGVSSTGEASESKAERVKPIGTNPNAKPKSSANTSGMLTVFGNSLVDPDTFEVYEMDGKTPFKGQPNAIIVRKARAFGMKENKDMTQPYDTDWGRYDPVKNKIIAPKEETPTPAEPVKSEREQSIISWLSNATNVSIIKDICRTSNSVEEVITKIINEHFSDAREEVKNSVRDILRFDSARKIVQSYIDETHSKKSSSEVTNFDSAFRVQNSKLLHKEDIIDVMSYSDVDLLLNIRHPGFPDSLMIVLDWDRGRFNVQFQFLPGVKYVQNTPEANEYDRILSKQEVQEIVDNYIPKDLQKFFTSGEYRKRESESQSRADQLYPNSLDDRIKYLITDPENSQGVLKNKWGIFWENPSTGYNNFPTKNSNSLQAEQPQQSVIPQAEQPVVSDEEVPQGDILESGDTLNADAKAKGYLRTERRKNVWEALNLAQKNALLAMSKLKGEQTMKTLESPSYFDNNKREFKKDITSLLGGFKLREAKSNSKVWNQQQERRWLAKVLPNLNQAERLRIVDAIIKVGNEKNPITAWGMFQNGVITIWNRAARGTLYHEAFHAVTDLLLTDEERKAMFDSAKQAYGNLESIALEERLAEDFRRYVQLEEKPVIGRLIRLFRTLKHILQNLLGKEPYLNTLFYKINRGEFANREPKVIKSTIKLSKNTAEEEEILRNAPRDSEGRLLAPNGKPSNLTERQYVQVRTKAFKEWFGDWENDPANASKVVDENGEPMVVYHHTDADPFTVFDLDRTGQNWKQSNRYGRKAAFFLSYEQTEMKDWGENVIPVFLNIRNPEESDISSIERRKPVNKDTDGVIPHIDDDAYYNDIHRSIKEFNYDEDARRREAFNNGLNRIGTAPLRGEFAVFSPNQIKSATDNIGTFDPNNPDIRYRLNNSKEETLKREMQRFLGNFGITLEEVDENYNGDLFDDLNRIIYYNSVEDITDGVGKAVAFMMQKQKVMTDLISLYNNFGNNTKGLKRGLKSVAKAVQKAQTEEEKRKADFRLPGQKKDENISDALEAIGKDISKELRKLYGFGEEKPSFLNKVWDVIVEFFRMLTPQTRMMFDIIKHQSQHIANSIKLNDKSLIIKGMVKPKTDSKATRVDVAQALRENPYEEEIIYKLSKYGIALAGSASIALNGTLYRPKENPLHDIDFQASQYNKESLNKIVGELSPYWMHTNTIAKEGEGSTETYMILDRPFVSEPYRLPKKNKEGEIKGYTKVAIIKDKNTGETLGYRINSDLILKDGVKGKMLDFFTGTESNPYGYHSMNLNGKNYLISDPRNALAAKIEWLRLKDLWDYNRYVPDDRIVSTSEQSDKEVAERVKNAKIIWGHPAIGKTTYVEKHKDEILEWDEEVNPKRNRFIDSQIDPDGMLSDAEKRQKKRDYMHNWKDHPEYIAFLTREWENLKARAERENKQIFASPTPLLNLFMDDFDLFLNLTEYEFMERNQAREAGGYYSSLGWKQAINDALVRVNPDKLVTTDKYFSQIMGDNSMTPSESSDKTPASNAELIHTTLGKIRSFYNSELSYGNLSDEQLEYLKQRKITKEQYNSMTMLEKEVLFKCMFDGD